MKFLYFETGGSSDSGVCVPASSVVGYDVHTDNTTVEIFFNDLGAANANDGSVVLAVTAGKTKEVVQAITEAINSGGSGTFIVVADDTNSQYLSSFISNCGAITLA